jgi:hypothetical protein
MRTSALSSLRRLMTRWRAVRPSCRGRTHPPHSASRSGLLLCGQRQEVEAVPALKLWGESPAPLAGCGRPRRSRARRGPLESSRPQAGKPCTFAKTDPGPDRGSSSSHVLCRARCHPAPARTRARVHVSGCTCTGCQELLASLIRRVSPAREEVSLPRRGAHPTGSRASPRARRRPSGPAHTEPPWLRGPRPGTRTCRFRLGQHPRQRSTKTGPVAPCEREEMTSPAAGSAPVAWKVTFHGLWLRQRERPRAAVAVQ